MLGLQTALSLALTELDMPIQRILALLSWQPAAIVRLDPAHGGGQGGPIEPGSVANLCVIDPVATWTVDPAALASRSRNSPFGGRTLRGRVRHTVFRGEPVVVDTEVQR